LLHLHHVLLLLRVVCLFLLLVLVVAEVHCLGHGRGCRGSDQHKIETHVLRLAERGRRGHDLGGSIRKNRAYFAHTNGLVHVLSAILPARRKVSTWIHWSSIRLEVEAREGRGSTPVDSRAENRIGKKRKQAE